MHLLFNFADGGRGGGGKKLFIFCVHRGRMTPDFSCRIMLMSKRIK